MEIKKQFKYFTIFEHEKEQEYLREMHKSGWKLTKITRLFVYHFEKCTPEDVVYQLDYNQEGVAHREEYVQMFRDCGWEYIQDFVGYSYFRKPTSEMEDIPLHKSEEIFCDDESRLQMMGRVFKGRMFPMLILFLFSAILIPLFILNINEHHYITATFLGGTLCIYFYFFAMCAVRYFLYEKNVKK